MKKTINVLVAVLLVALAVFVFTACGGGEDETLYKITIVSEGSGYSASLSSQNHVENSDDYYAVAGQNSIYITLTDLSYYDASGISVTANDVALTVTSPTAGSYSAEFTVSADTVIKISGIKVKESHVIVPNNWSDTLATNHLSLEVAGIMRQKTVGNDITRESDFSAVTSFDKDLTKNAYKYGDRVLVQIKADEGYILHKHTAAFFCDDNGTRKDVCFIDFSYDTDNELRRGELINVVLIMKEDVNLCIVDDINTTGAPVTPAIAKYYTVSTLGFVGFDLYESKDQQPSGTVEFAENAVVYAKISESYGESRRFDATNAVVKANGRAVTPDAEGFYQLTLNKDLELQASGLEPFFSAGKTAADYVFVGLPYVPGVEVGYYVLGMTDYYITDKGLYLGKDTALTAVESYVRISFVNRSGKKSDLSIKIGDGEAVDVNEIYSLDDQNQFSDEYAVFMLRFTENAGAYSVTIADTDGITYTEQALGMNAQDVALADGKISILSTTELVARPREVKVYFVRVNENKIALAETAAEVTGFSNVTAGMKAESNGTVLKVIGATYDGTAQKIDVTAEYGTVTATVTPAETVKAEVFIFRKNGFTVNGVIPADTAFLYSGHELINDYGLASVDGDGNVIYLGNQSLNCDIEIIVVISDKA